MTVDFAIRSLAAMLVDHRRCGPNPIPDDWYEEFDPGFVDYKKYIQSDEWKFRAEMAKRAAGYRCQVCNRGGLIDAHHRTYDRLGHERPEDITVLCRDCHKIFTEQRMKNPQNVYDLIPY